MGKERTCCEQGKKLLALLRCCFQNQFSKTVTENLVALTVFKLFYGCLNEKYSILDEMLKKIVSEFVNSVSTNKLMRCEADEYFGF